MYVFTKFLLIIPKFFTHNLLSFGSNMYVETQNLLLIERLLNKVIKIILILTFDTIFCLKMFNSSLVVFPSPSVTQI